MTIAAINDTGKVGEVFYLQLGAKRQKVLMRVKIVGKELREKLDFSKFGDRIVGAWHSCISSSKRKPFSFLC